MRIKPAISRFLLNKFYRSLWLKIAIALSIVISVPVISLGLFLINNSQQAVKKSVLTSHKEIVIRSAEEISLFLKRSEDVLALAAAIIGSAHFDPWHQETVLVDLVLEQPLFMRVTSFDLSGKMVATSDLGRFFVLNYTDNVMQLPLAGKTYISEVRFQDTNHLPYLTMALPVRENSSIKAILVAEINLRSMWDIVDGIRIGNTGRAFLVSSDGRLIASPDKKQVLRNEDISWQKDVAAALSGRNEAIMLQDEYGRRWVSSYAPVPATGWGIVLRQEQSEAYLFSRVMRWQSLLLIFFCEIIAVLMSAVLARLFVRPLKALLSRLKGATSADVDKVDISRQDELAELVKVCNALADKLKRAKSSEKFSSVGEAAVWIAHELKNSLAPIKSFVQLLPSRHTDGKFIDKFKDIVPEEISRCERMLKELSDFSSSAELRLRRTNIKDVIDDVLKIMEDQFVAGGIEVRLQADNTNLYIQGDYEKLKQVFINLLINAVSAMLEGGRINLAMRILKGLYVKDDSFVEVSITDTGIGIPGDRLKNIFEPFRTTKKEGVGLGLAISRRIIQQHGGEICVESQIERGTVFILRFPQEAINPKEAGVALNNIIK